MKPYGLRVEIFIPTTKRKPPQKPECKWHSFGRPVTKERVSLSFPRLLCSKYRHKHPIKPPPPAWRRSQSFPKITVKNWLYNQARFTEHWCRRVLFSVWINYFPPLPLILTLLWHVPPPSKLPDVRATRVGYPDKKRWREGGTITPQQLFPRVVIIASR